jgi:hypothetical protein
MSFKIQQLMITYSSQFLEQVKWVFSRLQSYLPLAAGVYTLTAMIVFYNYNVRDWYEYRVSYNGIVL